MMMIDVTIGHRTLDLMLINLILGLVIIM